MRQRRAAGKANVLLIVGAVVAVVVVLVVVVGLIGLWRWGAGLFEAQIKDVLATNPVIIKHLGDVVECKMDLAASGEAEGDEVFVFNVTGSKGNGVVTAECVTVDADTEQITSGTLRLASGETVDLMAVP